MSIATRTGDTGTTGLMYNRRVPKSHPRVEAYGTVDELNAALGIARAAAGPGPVQDQIVIIQRDLVALMGELAAHPDDLERYARDGFPRIQAASVAQLDRWIEELEATQPQHRDWATPGATLDAATLDLARTVARRAERLGWALNEGGQLENAQILIYLNRLGDLLWLLARQLETKGV